MDAKTVLFVGAGETNQLAARYLKKHSKVNFIWTNRTDSKAESAAKEIGGKSMLWNDFLSANLSPVDAVFLATNAGGHIFEHGQMKASCPKCIYDLSIPNNADKKLSEQMSIQYVDVDELGNILKREQERFEELKSELRDKIQNSKNEIMEFIDQKKLDPVITESLENIDLLLSSAFQKLPKELDGLNEEQRVALKLWSRSLMKKTKHEHIKQLRKLKQEEKRKK